MTDYVHAKGCAGEHDSGPCTLQPGYQPGGFVTPGAYDPVEVDSWSTVNLTPFVQQMDEDVRALAEQADVRLIEALRACCSTLPEAVHDERCAEERLRREQAAEDAAWGPVDHRSPIPVHEWHKLSHEGEDVLDPPAPLEPTETLNEHEGDDVIAFHAVTEASNVEGMVDYVQLQSPPTDTPDPADLPPRYIPPERAEPDLVNHPPHYKRGGMEVIDIIEAFDLGFRLGNVVKYILRADAKGATLQDLKKARWYLDREISAQEKETP